MPNLKLMEACTVAWPGPAAVTGISGELGVNVNSAIVGSRQKQNRSHSPTVPCRL